MVRTNQDVSLTVAVTFAVRSIDTSMLATARSSTLEMRRVCQFGFGNETRLSIWFRKHVQATTGLGINNHLGGILLYCQTHPI